MTQSDKSGRPAVGTVGVHIAGSIRWAVMKDGRIIIQFATDEDRKMALGFLELAPKLVRYDPEVPVMEYRIR